MYENQMQKAFAGMKADSGYDRVESWVAAKAIPAGVIVGKSGDGVAAGKNDGFVGIALHSHCIGDYRIKDCVSVMTIGLAWIEVAQKDASAAGDLVKVNDLGQLDSTAPQNIKNAVVHEIITTETGKLACVEVLAAQTAA